MINEETWTEHEKRLNEEAFIDEDHFEKWTERVKETYINELPDSEKEFDELFMSKFNDALQDINIVDFERENGEGKHMVTVKTENGETFSVDSNPFEYAVYEANLKGNYAEFLATLVESR